MGKDQGGVWSQGCRKLCEVHLTVAGRGPRMLRGHLEGNVSMVVVITSVSLREVVGRVMGSNVNSERRCGSYAWRRDRTTGRTTQLVGSTMGSAWRRRGQWAFLMVSGRHFETVR